MSKKGESTRMVPETKAELPKTHPFRTVYIGTKNGRKYRVARDENNQNRWRLDVAEFGIWEAVNPTQYRYAKDAIAAYNAIPVTE